MSIKVRDLSSGKIFEEKVCAGGFLNFLYSNPAGKTVLFCTLKRAFFSRMCGRWADSRKSAKSIATFVSKNGIDLSDSLRGTDSFETFNEFFSRSLRENARPSETGTNLVGFPADGRHLCFPDVSMATSFYVKDQRFDMVKFFGAKDLAERFRNGSMLISRLSPLDYHRFHFPTDGEIVARKLINGSLYSVSPLALRRNFKIFWENKRVLNIIENPKYGLCAFVEVGATNVGTIENFCAVGDKAERGAQAGLFKLGASCIVSIFERRVAFVPRLVENSAECIECYARANSTAGKFSV